MSPQPNESQLLIAFAHAASKAQEIEALFQELLIAAEVANDTRNRSFEAIAAEIEILPLAALKAKFLDILKAYITDPQFAELWKEVNEHRVFLMHRFFNVFPLTLSDHGLVEASQRLARIDAVLDSGRRFLKELRDRTYPSFNIPPRKIPRVPQVRDRPSAERFAVIRTIHLYEVRRRKDKRGVDLISDVLPFGRLCYDGPKATGNAVDYAKFFSRALDPVIGVYDTAGNVVEKHEDTGEFKSGKLQQPRDRPRSIVLFRRHGDL